jgi:hypothetical protein
MLMLWQKLAQGEFMASPSVWLAEIFSALAELTGRLVVRLSTKSPYFALDKFEIPTKSLPNFVETSNSPTFRYQLRCRNRNFDFYNRNFDFDNRNSALF